MDIFKSKDAASSMSKYEMVMKAVEKIAKDENDHDFKQWVEQKLQRSETLKIFSTGKTGSGKSTLLNGLVRSKFEVGHSLDAQTTGIEKHEHTIGNLKVIAWDSPGLQDKQSDHEEDYLKGTMDEMEKEGGIDLLFYCIRMDETRSDLEKHFSAIHTITNAFGHDIWENALIVLTFANMYELQLTTTRDPGEDLLTQFNKKIKEWKEKVVAELVKMKVDETVAHKVPIQPAEFYRQLHLPGREYWASLLWAQTFAAVKESSKSTLLAMNMERFTTEDKVPEDMSKKQLEDQLIVTTQTFKKIISEVLKENKLKLAAGGGRGAGTGAAVGACVGYFLKSTLTGAAVGGGIGAVAGAGVGFGLTACVLYYQYKKQEEEQQKKNV